MTAAPTGMNAAHIIVQYGTSNARCVSRLGGKDPIRGTNVVSDRYLKSNCRTIAGSTSAWETGRVWYSHDWVAGAAAAASCSALDGTNASVSHSRINRPPNELTITVDLLSTFGVEVVTVTSSVTA
jgi:hypothetical protein